MKQCFTFILGGVLGAVLWLGAAGGAGAQDDGYYSEAPQGPIISAPAPAVELTGKAGEISAQPQCFKVINQAPYTVIGSFITDVYQTPSGQAGRHRSNFNLETGASSQFCTQGPYFEGGKIELVLRTLVPVFSCKTRVDGDIVIHGRRKPEGGTDSWAVCR